MDYRHVLSIALVLACAGYACEQEDDFDMIYAKGGSSSATPNPAASNGASPAVNGQAQGGKSGAAAGASGQNQGGKAATSSPPAVNGGHNSAGAPSGTAGAVAAGGSNGMGKDRDQYGMCPNGMVCTGYAEFFNCINANCAAVSSECNGPSGSCAAVTACKSRCDCGDAACEAACDTSACTDCTGRLNQCMGTNNCFAVLACSPVSSGGVAGAAGAAGAAN